MRQTRRYPAAYLHIEGPTDEDIERLVDWLDVKPRDVTIVGSRLQNLSRSRLVDRLVRQGARTTNVKSCAVPRDANVLALWLSDADLGRVESHLPARIALAPWRLEPSALWRRVQEPVELTGAEIPLPSELNPVVAAAIDTVSMLSNPSNGLTGYNRGYAVDAFRILRRAGFVWDPIETAAVLARSGWDLISAREFADLSQQMLDGKALRGGGELAKDILSHWRQEATQR